MAYLHPLALPIQKLPCTLYRVPLEARKPAHDYCRYIHFSPLLSSYSPLFISLLYLEQISRSRRRLPPHTLLLPRCLLSLGRLSIFNSIYFLNTN